MCVCTCICHVVLAKFTFYIFVWVPIIERIPRSTYGAATISRMLKHVGLFR